MNDSANAGGFLLTCLHVDQRSVNLLVATLQYEWFNCSQKTLKVNKDKELLRTIDHTLKYSLKTQKRRLTLHKICIFSYCRYFLLLREGARICVFGVFLVRIFPYLD